MKVNEEVRTMLGPIIKDFSFETREQLFTCFRNYMEKHEITEFDLLTENEVIRCVCELKGIRYDTLNSDGTLMHLLTKGEVFRSIKINKKLLINVNDYLLNKDLESLLNLINLKFDLKMRVTTSNILFFKTQPTQPSMSFTRLSKELETELLYFGAIELNTSLSPHSYKQIINPEFFEVKTVNFKENKIRIESILVSEIITILNNLLDA